ncbi:MAG: IreB family regulatory phosphoprotein [Lachnospirales bacterium]
MDKEKMQHTQVFNSSIVPQKKPEEILKIVNIALTEKGYNPANQLVCYLLSGDPTYITSYNNARSLIMQLERDELLESIIVQYLNNL